MYNTLALARQHNQRTQAPQAQASRQEAVALLSEALARAGNNDGFFAGYFRSNTGQWVHVQASVNYPLMLCEIKIDGVVYDHRSALAALAFYA